MSNEITWSLPDRRPACAAPTVPAAGPERTVHAAFRAAASAVMSPPLERMISGSGSPACAAAALSRPR